MTLCDGGLASGISGLLWALQQLDDVGRLLNWGLDVAVGKERGEVAIDVHEKPPES
jgi:hypothetical protein